MGGYGLTDKVYFCFPIKMTDSVDTLAKLYVNEVIRLHGVPMSIMSERDPRFTSRLWPSLQRALGTKLNLSTTSHLQTDGDTTKRLMSSPKCRSVKVINNPARLGSNHKE